MTWQQYDYLRIKLYALVIQLKYNNTLTFFSFILLITSIFFIQMHPKSVWYYFSAGFFVREMLGLIFQQTSIKRAMKDVIKAIEIARKELL